MCGKKGGFWLLIGLVLALAGCAAEAPARQSAYMEPVESYYQALATGDYALLQQAMPEQVLDALGLDGGELMNLSNRLREEYGSGVSADAKEKGGVRLSDKQRKDLSTYLRRDYGITAVPEDGYLVEFTVTYSGSQTLEQTEAVTVYRLGERWYLDLTADSTVSSIRALYENEGVSD